MSFVNGKRLPRNIREFGICTEPPAPSANKAPHSDDLKLTPPLGQARVKRDDAPPPTLPS